MAALPKSFNLAEPIPTLPDGAMSQIISCRPVSGSQFQPQAIIEVDLPSRGWMDPNSLSFRYKLSGTAAVTNGSAMIATPVYTPFSRLSTLVGGANIETVSQWNQVAHVITQTSYDVGTKYGNQFGLGYVLPVDASGNSTGNMAQLDGRAIPAGAFEFSLAGPILGSVLSNSDKMLPLFAMPQVRLQFTVDSLTNMFLVGAVTASSPAFGIPTALNINNFEVVFNMCDLGAGVERMVYDLGQSISIKTHGYTNSAVPVPSATSGSSSYVFNQRFASIRGAFICPNRADGSGNRWAELVDVTTNNGDYQLQIGNQAFPQLPLSTVLNKAGILQETKRCCNSLYGNNAMSINSVEFNKTINEANTALYYAEPGKFISAINLEKIQSGDHVVFSGASTYNTPISCIINTATATTVAATLNLILDYDAVLVLNPVARQLSVRS
jgi:hypothetical protein